MTITKRTRRISAFTGIGILAALAVILAVVIAAVPAQTNTDYDTDDDGYIEISTHQQLNAMRWDLDANGDVAAGNAANYLTAFPNRDTNAATRMGCPSGTCTGYELTANINLDTNGSGGSTWTSADAYYNSGAGWLPIGDNTNNYTGDFKGNGFTVQNLFISRSTTQYQGLFGVISSAARIEALGVTDVSITASHNAGGLVGISNGEIVACYTTGSVTGRNRTGGLVGYLNSGATIHTSYSRASAAGQTGVGGLVCTRNAANGTTITNSYSTGAVSRTSGVSTAQLGLVGSTTGSGSGSVSNSYWDSQTSGKSTSAGGTAQTTTALQAPLSYSGIYSTWKANLDGVAGNEDPWDFGLASAYPILVYHYTDYDTDEDGYIEVESLAQLNAIRHDLNGDGLQGSTSATDWANHTAAYPNANTSATKRMGCTRTCTGYELAQSLDFDENGDGDITASGDPTYWNSGEGWDPIGDNTSAYAGDFKGNGYIIDNLYISRSSTDYQALFANTATASRIESLGVTNVNVTGNETAGGLAAYVGGDIVGSYTTGSVSAASYAGGMVGYLTGTIHSSHSTASASATGNFVGGMAGYSEGSTITNSYSTGAVSGSSAVGGFIGHSTSNPTQSDSYWDTTTSGTTTGVGFVDPFAGSAGSAAGVTGLTTAQLQAPTAYATTQTIGGSSTAIYANWNANIDGETGNDDPWDFGTSSEYPVLKWSGLNAWDQGRGDYDLDNDGYIEISTIDQLAAIEHDLDANGDATASAYASAFPSRDTRAASRMGCPSSGCTGYELVNSLDFDVDGDGDVDSSDTTHHNWQSIGDDNNANRYTGNFNGNGHTINNLTISRSGTGNQGLFDATNTGRIEQLGITNANITAGGFTGILAGNVYGGTIVAVYTTGRVSGGANVGGIVGYLAGGSLSTSYSTAYVNGSGTEVGGLVGDARVNITNSYSTGRVTGVGSDVGGLVGFIFGSPSASNSYWDSIASGQASSALGTTQTTRALQTPTGYTGIYANWNINLDGEAGNDDPWDFGTGMQYPMLKYKGMSVVPQNSLSMGVPDNWNAPVAGERIGVCLVAGPTGRGTVSGQTYYEGWTWEWSTNGDTWTAYAGSVVGDNPPTYEFSPAATDVGRYIRAKMTLADGSVAYTRPLGGRVEAADDIIPGATPGGTIPFSRGNAAPQVGTPVVASHPLPAGASDARYGWQSCPNNTAPHSDCTTAPASRGASLSYTPVAADVGRYLRMYAYYQTSDGTWTRRVTPFTTGVVSTQ